MTRKRKNKNEGEDVNTIPSSSLPPVISSSRSLGIFLRHAREEKALTPALIEAQLKIKEEYILALENGHYHALPTTTHAKGFLRSYALFLGLENKLPELLERFADETAALQPAPALQMPTPLPSARTPGRSVAIGGIVGAVIIYLLFAAWQSPPAPVANDITAPVTEPAPVPLITPAPQMSLPVAPLPVETVPVETPPAEEPPAPPAPSTSKLAEGIVVRAVQESWVQVQDAVGATIYSRLMRVGEEYVPPALPGLTLTAGNGAGIVLVRNGTEGKPVGAPAEVVKGVKLTPVKAMKQN